MTKINLVLILTIMSLTQSIAEEMVEPQEMEQLEIIQPEPTAVSKVMERFSGLVVPTAESIQEEVSTPVEEKEAITLTTDSSLAIIEPIKTAKFETKEMPYFEDKKVVEKAVEKEPKSKVKSRNSIEDLEANARKVIEEETKKVEEAKANALKRISEVMSRLKEEKNKEF